jgi:hypothetical protein
VLPLNLYSDLEISSCWYSSEEFESMRAAVGDAARCLEKTGIVRMIQKEEGDEDFCRRGVERFTRTESLERRKDKDAGLDAVLDEQYMQNGEGFEDPEYIAHLYKIASRSAKRKAHAIGVMYALEALM